MFYCDMGPNGAEIRSTYKSRTVGQYVIVKSTELPLQLAYKAHTIVSLTPTGDMFWHKNRDKEELLGVLSDEEKAAVMIQILKSEIW